MGGPPTTPAIALGARSRDRFLATRRVALLSILLAATVEVVLLAIDLVVGPSREVGDVLADAIRLIAWAFLVCEALALALLLGGARPGVTAAIGLLGAPVASLLSRSLVEVAHALTFAGPPKSAPDPLLVALIRGLEYATLGLLAAWLARRRPPRAVQFGLAGLATGLVFGTLVLLNSPLPTSAAHLAGPLLRWADSEVFFPVGCALILWATQE